MRIVVRHLAVAGAIVCLAALAASAVAAGGQRSTHTLRTYKTRNTAPLVTALTDPWLFNSSQREKAFALTRAAGATYVRLALNWNAIAPSSRPAGFVATDPTSPGYNWSNYDVEVQQAQDAGLIPILAVSGTPNWAYAKRPKGVNAGSPKAAALGQFATALVTHYDGANGGASGGASGNAPVTHFFQVWNEPNTSLFMSPVNAKAYRGMVNAFANAAHAVDRRSVVIAGDLDPFGKARSKKQKWNSVAPLTFMRSLLCVSSGNPKAKKKALRRPHRTCRQRVHFDVWSHHPYTFGGAFGHAKRPNDVELGDLPQMTAVLRAAKRFHHIVSPHPVKFWVTEFSWDSKPPRKGAAPMALAARWTAESLYQMWRSGVSLVTWFGLQDTGGHGPYQSGLFRHSKSVARAHAKPVRTAFRFPFVAYLGRRSVTVWGRDATSNKRAVTIQLRNGKHGHWRAVAKIRANKSGIFKANLRLKAPRKGFMRAKAAGSGTSLSFSLKVPHAPHIGPWG